MNIYQSNSVPFGPDHLELIRTNQRRLHDLLPILDKAEAVGVDTSQARAVHSAMSEKFTQYMREFFPAAESTGVPIH
jgi:hypothetical protein